jgi:hypothetical protein
MTTTDYEARVAELREQWNSGRTKAGDEAIWLADELAKELSSEKARREGLEARLAEAHRIASEASATSLEMGIACIETKRDPSHQQLLVLSSGLSRAREAMGDLTAGQRAFGDAIAARLGLVEVNMTAHTVPEIAEGAKWEPSDAELKALDESAMIERSEREDDPFMSEVLAYRRRALFNAGRDFERKARGE